MQETEIIQVLTTNSDFFQNATLAFTYIFRPLGWMLIEFLMWVANICQSIYSAAFKFLDFTTYLPVQKFLSEFKGAVVVVLAISLFILACTLLLQPEKKPPVVVNFLIGMFVVCSSATLLNSINKLMIQSEEYISSTYSDQGQAADELVSSNLTDLLYVDKHLSGGLRNMTPNNIPHASLTGEQIKNINYSEVIETDSEQITTDGAKDILSQKTTYFNDEYFLTEIDDGNFITKLFAEFYYRYKLNFGTVILSLLALCIVFLIMGYKIIRLVIELITSQFLVYITSGDIFSGQGMKKLLDFVKNIYIVMLYTMVSIKLFILATGYVGNMVDENIRGIILLFIALAWIDGPMVIEKLLGIDAGLQAGVGKGIAAAHLVSGAARSIGGMVQMHRTNANMRSIGEALNGMNGQNSQGNSSSSNTGQGSGYSSTNMNANGGQSADMREGNATDNEQSLNGGADNVTGASGSGENASGNETDANTASNAPESASDSMNTAQSDPVENQNSMAQDLNGSENASTDDLNDYLKEKNEMNKNTDYNNDRPIPEFNDSTNNAYSSSASSFHDNTRSAGSGKTTSASQNTESPPWKIYTNHKNQKSDVEINKHINFDKKD